MNRRSYILVQALLWVIGYPLLAACVLRPPFHAFEIIIGVLATCGWAFNLYVLAAPFFYGKELQTKTLSLTLPAQASLSFPVHGLSGAKLMIFSRTSFLHLKGFIRLVDADGTVVHQLLLNDVYSDTGVAALKTTRTSAGGKGARLDQLRTLTLPRINSDAPLAELKWDLEWFPSGRSLKNKMLDLEITLRGRKVPHSRRTTVEFS